MGPSSTKSPEQSACQASTGLRDPDRNRGNRFRNEQFNEIAGKDRFQKRLDRWQAASHDRNRAWITLQKIIDGTVPQCFDAVRGCPYDEMVEGGA
jgi:hypothetical protein